MDPENSTQALSSSQSTISQNSTQSSVIIFSSTHSTPSVITLSVSSYLKGLSLEILNTH